MFEVLSQDAKKVLKAYNTEELTKFHKRKVPNTDVVEESQVDPCGPSEPDSGLFDLPETDLGIPEDLTLIFVNSQCHRSEDVHTRLTRYQPPMNPLILLRGPLTIIILTI